MSQPTKQAALEYALDRLVRWARSVSAAGDIKFSGDHPLTVAEALLATPSPHPAPTVPADRAGLVEECKRLAAFVLHYQRQSEQYSSSSEQYPACWDHVRNGTEELHAAIDRLASSAAQVPEGWQLVPKRPNQDMLRAAAREWLKYGEHMAMFPLAQNFEHIDPGHQIGLSRATYVYEAMLAAAPAAGGQQCK